MNVVLAIAGGAPPGGEDWCNCCGMFVILPAVLFLNGLGWIRGYVWPAFLAFLLSGLPSILLVIMVAGYQPSHDADVMADQEGGKNALVFYSLMTIFSGVSGVGVVIRLHRRGWKFIKPKTTTTRKHTR